MKILLEVLGELFLEIFEYINENKRINNWIRYPILILFMLFMVSVLVGLLLLGILLLKKDIIVGIFLIGFDCLILFLLLYRIYQDKRKK